MPRGDGSPKIVLPYGDRQTFRRRSEDINILGCTSLPLPAKRSQWRLNGGPPVHIYVERRTTAADPARYPWSTRTPAVNRLLDRPGHFNIEIPVDARELRPGSNRIALLIEGDDGERAELDAEIGWDPSAVDLPLDLSDLGPVRSIQDIGQAVDGVWDLDPAGGAIVTRAPVACDALLLLGAAFASQEATYNVEFSAPLDGVFLGLSDFFVRHDEQSSGLGIKPGYSTAGLATLGPGGLAECWAAMGDNTWGKDWSWARKTEPPAVVSIAPGTVYAVRHQAIFDGGECLARFRLWPAARPEPKRWLCTVHTAALPPERPRPAAASFGLFQHSGNPTRWSNVKVRPIEAKIAAEDVAADHPLVAGWRTVRYRANRLSQRARRKARKLFGA